MLESEIESRWPEFYEKFLAAGLVMTKDRDLIDDAACKVAERLLSGWDLPPGKEWLTIVNYFRAMLQGYLRREVRRGRSHGGEPVDVEDESRQARLRGFVSKCGQPIDREIRARVLIAMRSMPFEQRRLLFAYHMRGEKQTQIARRLGINEGTLWSQMQLALKAFRKHPLLNDADLIEAAGLDPESPNIAMQLAMHGSMYHLDRFLPKNHHKRKYSLLLSTAPELRYPHLGQGGAAGMIEKSLIILVLSAACLGLVTGVIEYFSSESPALIRAEADQPAAATQPVLPARAPVRTEANPSSAQARVSKPEAMPEQLQHPDPLELELSRGSAADLPDLPPNAEWGPFDMYQGTEVRWVKIYFVDEYGNRGPLRFQYQCENGNRLKRHGISETWHKDGWVEFRSEVVHGTLVRSETLDRTGRIVAAGTPGE